MLILVKIVKIGQLQMVVESREPIMHSGFFCLKHTYIIAEQKNFIYNVSYGSHPHNKFPSDHGKMVTKSAVAEWVQTMKFVSSQNHMENFVVITLGRFPINKTQN
jgi:hypothetical protein